MVKNIKVSIQDTYEVASASVIVAGIMDNPYIKALLRNGQFSTTKKLINQFVNMVLVYQNHVELFGTL